eukprot:scaffold565_cov358-Prasinococcus_capsulatus_cf.AAC.12
MALVPSATGPCTYPSCARPPRAVPLPTALLMSRSHPCRVGCRMSGGATARGSSKAASDCVAGRPPFPLRPAGGGGLQGVHKQALQPFAQARPRPAPRRVTTRRRRSTTAGRHAGLAARARQG